MLAVDDSDDDNDDIIHDTNNKKNQEYNQRDSSGSNNKHNESASKGKKKLVILGDSIVKMLTAGSCQNHEQMKKYQLNHSVVQQQNKYQPTSNLQLKKNPTM